jgi:hypothetical protein
MAFFLLLNVGLPIKLKTLLLIIDILAFELELHNTIA